MYSRVFPSFVSLVDPTKGHATITPKWGFSTMQPNQLIFLFFTSWVPRIYVYIYVQESAERFAKDVSVRLRWSTAYSLLTCVIYKLKTTINVLSDHFFLQRTDSTYFLAEVWMPTYFKKYLTTCFVNTTLDNTWNCVAIRMQKPKYIIIMIVIIIIALKGTFQDIQLPPHCTANCLQHARSSGLGEIMCKTCATHWTLIMCNMLFATWY